MIDSGDFDHASQILSKMPALGGALDIERMFLTGRLAARRGEYDDAIAIFRQILDKYPDLARVRFELAVCYMQTQQWRRADYQLRLAMAGDDLPADARAAMNYFRYIVRQNKNWNVWFNFGAAPDNNINTTAGGEECIDTMFGPLCRQLPDPERAFGFNFTLGGNYEFKMGQNWRWKSDANIYTNIYDKHKFDDLLLSASTGPRYVWSRGDVWLAGVAGRRWYGWDAYNWSVGARADVNYDFSRKVSGGLSLQAMKNIYDEYADLLSGETYGANANVIYSLDASKHLVFRGGLWRETTADPIYSNWRPIIGAGFGMELPARFNIYMDAYAYWQNYDGARWVVKDGGFNQIAERSFTHRYAVSLSNSRFSVWNFVPAITVSYMRRDSNIWQREFDKWSVEFTMQQRF